MCGVDIPFVAISCWRGCKPFRNRSMRRDAGGSTSWQRFRYITLPMLSPIIAVVMTFSVLFTFTDFQMIYVLTRGGPLNATHLMATLSFQRAIPGGQLGEGAAIAVAMIPFFWRRSCSAISAFSAANGSRGGRLMASHICPSVRAPSPRHGLILSGTSSS